MEKVKEEAEALQRVRPGEAGDILSSAVADVAAARPEDPIDFLAHRLYTTRRQHTVTCSAGTVTCSAGSGAVPTRPSLGIATLRPRQSHGNRATRLTRYRPENEMSQIQVKNVKKTEKAATKDASGNSSSELEASVFKKLGLNENGQLSTATQQNQKETRFYGGSIGTARVVSLPGDHVLQDATSSSSRRHVFAADDEGFEETVSYGSSTKPVFVHLCLKNNLSGLHCDLFDDYDLT